jgi:hypothetical protein
MPAFVAVAMNTFYPACGEKTNGVMPTNPTGVAERDMAQPNLLLRAGADRDTTQPKFRSYEPASRREAQLSQKQKALDITKLTIYRELT